MRRSLDCKFAAVAAGLGIASAVSAVCWSTCITHYLALSIPEIALAAIEIAFATTFRIILSKLGGTGAVVAFGLFAAASGVVLSSLFFALAGGNAAIAFAMCAAVSIAAAVLEHRTERGAGAVGLSAASACAIIADGALRAAMRDGWAAFLADTCMIFVFAASAAFGVRKIEGMRGAKAGSCPPRLFPVSLPFSASRRTNHNQGINRDH